MNRRVGVLLLLLDRAMIHTPGLAICVEPKCSSGNSCWYLLHLPVRSKSRKSEDTFKAKPRALLRGPAIDTCRLELFGIDTRISYLIMAPTEEQIEDLLLSCRYGELDEVKAFVEEHGWDPISAARDDRGNTVLHMCCGNGHLGMSPLTDSD